MARKENKIFLNFTNHPIELWEEAQKNAARKYGDFFEMAFPQIEPSIDKEDIQKIANEYLERIYQMAENTQLTVHIMGEMTFVYAVVSKLIKRGITCVASTTKRKSVFMENNKKLSDFQFVRFREYC